jgi:hypothetical protein
MQTYRFFLQLTKDIGNYSPLAVKENTIGTFIMQY